MTFRFPLKDVTIQLSPQKTMLTGPLYADKWHQVTQHEFTLDVPGVAAFYARHGKEITICPYDGHNHHTLELYLNGSVYGAILHQRKILPLHGSAFAVGNQGILVCGHSGAGKSSLTAAFCLDGSRFLTDDVTPIEINGCLPFIIPLSDRIKLWDHALEQLLLPKEGLIKINEHNEKFFFPMEHTGPASFPLAMIFIVQVAETEKITSREIKGGEKFTILRSQLYRPEYLLGMPENEAAFFYQLAAVCNAIRIMQVIRPAIISIESMKATITKLIHSPAAG